MVEYLKHLVIRTPLEGPLHAARGVAERLRAVRHPQLRGIFLENVQIRRLARRLIRPDTNCIDVGAHLGSMLALFMRLAPRGRHIGVEPAVEKFRWLRAKFPDATLHDVALAESAGEAVFYVNRERTGYSALRDVREGSGERTEKVVVRKARLDDILEPGYTVGFMKIDVVGAELGVLRGGRATILRDRPHILLECTRDGLKPFGVSPAEVFGCVTADLGYRLFLVRDYLEGGSPLDASSFERAQVYPYQGFNFLCAPPGR